MVTKSGAVLLIAQAMLGLVGCNESGGERTARSGAPAQTAAEMETAFDISYTDYPMLAKEYKLDPTARADWEAKTWGERGLENVIDTVLAAGVKRIHFRSHAAGPWWPTKIEQAEPSTVAKHEGRKPTFKEWNAVSAAVKAGHRKGVQVIAWFDLTEGHGGHPTAWALKHPQFCVVRRDGSREDGSKRDPILSFAYPEVVRYRLGLIQELLDFGVDGIYLVVNASVGYEKPVRQNFMEKYDLDPNTLAQDDARWIQHQSGYFTSFLRRVQELIRSKENSSGRKLELILEGQNGAQTPSSVSEAGWPNIPTWAGMPSYIDVEEIAKERLVDCISFWKLAEIDKLNDEVRRNVKIGTRYRWFAWPEGFSEQQFRTRQVEAGKRGVSLFVVNEVRYALVTARWMYPGQPGPLYVLLAEGLGRRR